MSIVIDRLKSIGYDWLESPVGDGVTDDSDIINLRINSGLSAFGCSSGSSFKISRAITCNSKIVRFEGKAAHTQVMVIG